MVIYVLFPVFKESFQNFTVRFTYVETFLEQSVPPITNL